MVIVIDDTLHAVCCTDIVANCGQQERQAYVHNMFDRQRGSADCNLIFNPVVFQRCKNAMDNMLAITALVLLDSYGHRLHQGLSLSVPIHDGNTRNSNIYHLAFMLFYGVRT